MVDEGDMELLGNNLLIKKLPTKQKKLMKKFLEKNQDYMTILTSEDYILIVADDLVDGFMSFLSEEGLVKGEETFAPISNSEGLYG
jgi:hypothetical protein